MGSSIIEVGIGLVLVFSLISLIVTQINNIIKNALNIRGNLFRQELERLLQDSSVRQAILSHPAVGLLTEANEGSAVRSVSADVLAEVLLDVLAGDGETLEMLENLANSPLVDSILGAVESEPLRARLKSVLATARNLENAKVKLTQWFDTSLDRAGAVFKRRMQLLSLICGAVLAIVLNVDTIYVAQSLWNDPVLRQTTVEAADTTINRVDQDTAEAQATGDLEAVGEAVEAAQSTVNTLLDLRLPIGWYYEPISEEQVTVPVLDARSDTRNLWNILPGGNPNWLGLLIQKILGLALTTIAVMQGAPFWFDLLRRATGNQ